MVFPDERCGSRCARAATISLSLQYGESTGWKERYLAKFLGPVRISPTSFHFGKRYHARVKFHGLREIMLPALLSLPDEVLLFDPRIA